jgi:hypothetical protein
MTEDIVNVLKVAFEQHRAGNVQDAELGYRRVITKDAHQPDALHLLGVLSKNQDHVQGACDFLTRVHHDALAWTECVTAAGGGSLVSTPQTPDAYVDAAHRPANDLDRWSRLQTSLQSAVEQNFFNYYQHLQ